MEGVGAADDPGNGESFGMHRCRLLAEGLVEAYRSNIAGTDARIKAVQARFSQNGLNLDAPYLAPGLAEYPLIPTDSQEVA
jgi:hypothetical protein